MYVLSDRDFRGPAEGLVLVLKDQLQRIARAKNLVALASENSPGADRDPNTAIVVDVELIKYRDKADRKGQAVKWQGSGLALHDGDLVAFRLHNRSRAAVDVTLLFVDSDYGIQVVFPPHGTITDNRLPPGYTFTTPRSKISAGKTQGLEHVVVIAVQAEGVPVDFSCLEQKTIHRTRGGTQGAIDSPLGRIFQNALYADGGNRGMDKADFDKSALQLLSWQTLPRSK
jgi:hypothetical protein